MKLVIFSEAGFEYGFGHFYRMSGICEKAIKEHREAELHLVADDSAKKNLDREYVKFTDWHKPDNYEKLLDKDTTLVVDSYHVEISELEEFQRLSKDMIVIDDNIRLDYHDMKILNPNYFAVCLKYPSEKNNTYYIGSNYTLLRSEFDYSGERIISDNVRNVLVTMGGTDLKGLTADAIRCVKQYSKKTSLHVVCTKAYHMLDEIRGILGEGDILYTNIGADEMCRLMKNCDFAIGTAGQTTNEVIKMQLPSVLIAVADNQMINTRYLSEEGVIEAIYYDNNLKESDYKIIQSMFSKQKRQILADNMRRLKSNRSGKDLICEIAFGGNNGQ